MRGSKVAVLIPCFNEAVSIAKVVADFQTVLPDASIYVYDNNSSDGTADKARNAGAITRHETHQGKGHVIRRMFRDIEADYYIMVDGDDTYAAATAPAMLHLAIDGLYDLVNAVRVAPGNKAAYRTGHRLGNKLLTGLVLRLFGDRIQDMLSGYKVFSRRFVKSFPILSQGFDIETELTIHALELEMPVANLASPYKERPSGSESKLRTYRDGFRILIMIMILLKHERPLHLFLGSGVALILTSLFLGLPVVVGYFATGFVPRFPTAFLAMGVMLIAFLSITTGIILDGVTRGRKEMRLLAYLHATGVRSPDFDVSTRMSITDNTPAISTRPMSGNP
jgi:glycosyltransferase involved in cell wall biosynthesis